MRSRLHVERPVASNSLLLPLMAVEQDIFRIEGSITGQEARIANGRSSDPSLALQLLATLQDTLALANERRSIILRRWH